MSLQQTALRLPEGGDDWQLAAEAEGAPPIEQTAPTEQTQVVQEPDGEQQLNQPLTPQLSDLDRLALANGWTTKDQWRGDPNKWVPSEQYLANTFRVLDRTKNELRMTRAMTDEMNARLARVEQGFDTSRVERAQALREEYENAKFEAAKAGDGELFRKLDKEQQDLLAKLQPEQRPARPETANEAQVYAQAENIMRDPAARAFFEANPVALENEEAWTLMDREMARVAQAGGTSAQQFRAAQDLLQFSFPQAYQRGAFNGHVPANGGASGQQHHSQQQPRDPNGQWSNNGQQTQQRRPAPPINGANSLARPAVAKAAVEELPKEARDYLNREVAAGRVKDQERWARTFLGEKVTVRGRSIRDAQGART